MSITSWDDVVLQAHFVEHLVEDPERRAGSRQVRGAMYSPVVPTPVAAPRVVAWSAEMAAELQLDASLFAGPSAAKAAARLSGNAALEGSRPYASAYGGHQFGHWAGQLGDGRAISLGELLGSDGQRQEIQLKGAGPTPYSRSADGRAVLRSSVREFLMSEAMHHLGIPTTRALALVLTGDEVIRDMFYDGNAAPEPGAIVTRVAPSFLRFGNFQLFAQRGEIALLRQLTNFTIENYFPALADEHGLESPKTALAFFREVVARTAHLMSDWMRVGFVHGVMNTDNMSILGLTIDYGPYGWIDAFDPNWTPNTTDAQHRRYRFGQQPHVAWWNLARLAEALAPLGLESDALSEALDGFSLDYETHHTNVWRQKLGLNEAPRGDVIENLFRCLTTQEVDMTLFFRALAAVDTDTLLAGDDAAAAPVWSAVYGEVSPTTRTAMLAWLKGWAAVIRREARPKSERVAAMNAVNPKYVLRNYLAQVAIDDATNGEFNTLHRLQRVLTAPYAEQPEAEDLAQLRPEWAKSKAGCSMLSCSS